MVVMAIQCYDYLTLRNCTLNNVNTGQAFGLALKMLAETPVSHIRVGRFDV